MSCAYLGLPLLLFCSTLVCFPQRSCGEETDDLRTRMTHRVDELLAASWQAAEIQPVSPSSPAEFLRRAYLDLNGITPTAAEARSFLRDDRPLKRAELIDRLLQSPRYATHLANIWRNTLVTESADFAQIESIVGLENWLREQFAQNLPYDAFVAKFLVASRLANGPGVFYTSLELKPEKLAAKTAQIFLGVQMQCAECHDHPFDHWSQEDFWGYAAFFAQLEQRSEGQRQVRQRLLDADRGEVTLPESNQTVAPKYPGGRRADADEGGSRRLQLSIWMSSRDNPYLPRAAVNRVWAQLFGRGLVEPVDDMSPKNPPSHPQLLDELATYFAQSGFDLKNLYRTLADTKAYQLASVTNSAAHAADFTETHAELFAVMNVKSLRAEQIYDSLERFLPPAPSASPPIPAGLADRRRIEFITQMRMQTRNARDFDRGAAQALMLMNGAETQQMTSAEQGRFLTALTAPWLDDRQRVETLFLATLSRFPTETEYAELDSDLGDIAAGDVRPVLGDVLWALVNSAEFSLNQ